jgi:hypothetical protein
MRCIAPANNAEGRMSAMLAFRAGLICVNRETARDIRALRDETSQAGESEIPLLCFRDQEVAKHLDARH